MHKEKALAVVISTMTYVLMVYCTAISGGKNAIGVYGFGSKASGFGGIWDTVVEFILYVRGKATAGFMLFVN